MKIVFQVIVLCLFADSIFSQNFFRSVDDIDSYVYTCADDKLLILKRDVQNVLSLENIIQLQTHQYLNQLNSIVIIENHLVCALFDTLVLFSISDRENPLELHRIQMNGLKWIEEFGELLLVYTYDDTISCKVFELSSDYLNYKTEIKFIGDPLFPRHSSKHTHKFPYFYVGEGNQSIRIFKYFEDTGQLNLIESVPLSRRLAGLAANSQYLYSVESLLWQGLYINQFFRYTISGDSITNRTFVSEGWYGFPEAYGWIVTDSLGVREAREVYNVVEGNPSQYYSKNISATDYSILTIKNSIYALGANLWYLDSLGQNNLSFKKFSMINSVSPLSGSRHLALDLLLSWNSISSAISYRLQLSENASFTQLVLDTTISTNFYQANELPEGSGFWWKVAPQFNFGSTGFIGAFNFFTKLNNPDSISAVRISDNIIQLNWVDRSEKEINYYILRSELGGQWTNLATLSANTTSFNDTNVVANQGYTYGIYCRSISHRSDTIMISTITDVEHPESTDQYIFSLSQNYPNPFNPSTKISWQSPVGGHQTLKVYDVLGREVVTLVDEFRDAGSYEVEFDARNLSSGVYYYRLKVGEFIQTTKMIYLK